MTKFIAVSLLMGFLACPVAFAGDDPDWIMDTSGIGSDDGEGRIQSNQILELGQPTANALQIEGESALRSNNLDRALMVLQRSVEMAPADMDKRILYATTLEKKLMKMKKPDPVLYNFLVKQWLFIWKQSDFPDQSVQAHMHLQTLTGTVPKMFEKPNKFLARVLVPEDGSEKVALGGKKPKLTE